LPGIDAERLLSDLDTLRTIGAQGRGVVRPAFSAKDMEARRWLAEKFADAGLEATIDGVGNVYGRSRKAGKALLVGSHSDTQPTGGWLDGALGVVYALEVVRALGEDPATARLAVDAISFQDEESRFLGCLGSRSFVGTLSPEQESGAVDSEGTTLAEALERAGLAGRPRLHADPSRQVGFLEAHIEQGPHLEDEAKQIGVVTTIVGLRNLRIVFRGQQNHAGTTMMARRRDAAAALFDFAAAVNREFPRVAAARSVWTMGRVRVVPNAPSIVPGYVELDLQFRDADEAVLDRLEALAARLVVEANARGTVAVTLERSRAPIAATRMNEVLRKHLAIAAQRHAPERWVEMPSGAFHDAGVVSARLPAAMLFIPSVGGISHDFAEDSRREDIVLGCRVLADAAASILGSDPKLSTGV
jgi:N-carbamoyl-L-amino-acid hydrolase